VVATQYRRSAAKSRLVSSRAIGAVPAAVVAITVAMTPLPGQEGLLRLHSPIDTAITAR
jgi:hypothetical protein